MTARGPYNVEHVDTEHRHQKLKKKMGRNTAIRRQTSGVGYKDMKRAIGVREKKRKILKGNEERARRVQKAQREGGGGVGNT
jgi:hypothetical protein